MTVTNHTRLTLIVISVFFLRFAPFYYIGVQSTLLTTHVLSIGILLLLVGDILLQFLKKNVIPVAFGLEEKLIILFFLSQSLSIIEVTDLSIYLNRYSKIVIGLVLYIVIKYSLKIVSIQKLRILIINTLLYGSFITIFFQFLLFLYPSFILKLSDGILLNNLHEIITANIDISNKLHDNSYVEIIVPLLIYKFFSGEKNFIKKILPLIMVLLLGFVSFASNFRYRILSYLVSLGSAQYFIGHKKKQVVSSLLLLLSIGVVLLSANSFLRDTFNFTVIDRFLLEEEGRDYSPIQWRLEMYRESIFMAQSHITGVGLGGFFNALPENQIKLTTLYGGREKIALGALTSGPHNIFFQYLGETGIIGLILFVILMLFWTLKDFKVMMSNKKNMLEKKALTISFWTLMIIVQFFPAINLSFYTLFFLLRSLL